MFRLTPKRPRFRVYGLSRPSLQTITTESGTTPTTPQVTLTAQHDSFVVHTGEQPVNEPYFDLYVKVNSSAVKKVRLYRWQGRIIKAATGASIALSTANGRALKVSPLLAPTTLPTATGVSGMANCDKAGPPLWQPSAPHVTLPANGSALTIVANGTERAVFIREFDGTTWTPLRFYILSATQNLRILCSYKQVAIANYAGAALGITAPTGSVIGGTSTTMALTIAAPTGTTRTVSTMAELNSAIAAAVAGDEIVLADGTYSLDSNITAASFAANVAAGRKGMEGIIIRSASGNRDNCVLTGSSTTTGNWLLSHTGALASASFKDLTFNFQGLSVGFEIIDGDWKIQNCRYTGPRADGQDNFNFVCTQTGGILCDLLYCQADNSAADCYNGGSGGDTGNANSVVRLIDCVGHTPGGAENNQGLTTHGGLPVSVYGSHFYNAFLNIIANDSESQTHLFFTKVEPGSRRACVISVTLFGCNISSSLDTVGLAPNGYALFSKIAVTGYAGTTSLLRNATTQLIAHNRLSGNSGRALFPSIGGSTIIGNIISGFSEGVRVDNYSTGSTAASLIYGNTIGNCNTGLNLNSASLPVTLKNNACKTNNASVATTVAAFANHSVNYNVLDPTVSANYSLAGANDTTGVDAALGGEDLPTPSGNCDGTGDPALFDYLGGSDPYGFPLIYKSGRISRGARDIPALYSAADIVPDVW